MSEIMEPVNENPPGEELSWREVWISVLTKPSVATFEWILRDPTASPRRAYLWVFITALISGIFTSAYAALGLFTGFNEYASPLVYLLICTPLIAVFSVLVLALNTWITQWIAGRFFNGSGNYDSLIYATASYLAPYYLISGLISSIPFVNCLVIPLSIYYFVLGVISVKAVNKFGWGPAVVSYFAFTGILLIIACIGTICVLALLGPFFVTEIQNITPP